MLYHRINVQLINNKAFIIWQKQCNNAKVFKNFTQAKNKECVKMAIRTGMHKLRQYIVHSTQNQNVQHCVEPK